MSRPPPEERPSLEELCSPQAGTTCPKCGRQMLAEKTIQHATSTVRYRGCVCGYKVLTRQARERETIIREVSQHKKDSSPGNETLTVYHDAS